MEAGSPLKVKGWDTLPRVFTHQVGWPVLQARHVPQLARVAMTTWSPGLTEVTSEPTASTTPAPSWPEHGRRLPRDGPVDHRQVAVADPGGADGHPDLVGPGIPDAQLVGDLGAVTGVDDASHGTPPSFVDSNRATRWPALACAGTLRGRSAPPVTGPSVGRTGAAAPA